jgi:hypothetical protein
MNGAEMFNDNVAAMNSVELGVMYVAARSYYQAMGPGVTVAELLEVLADELVARDRPLVAS